MPDNQVSVELIAKIDSLISGLNEAKAAVTGATGQIASDVHGMAEAVEKEEGLLHEVLSGALFLEYAEIAKMAFEVVQEAFEKTIGQAMEFGLANAKFAAMMGTSEEEAAGLAAALHGVGSSADAYEGMALKLEMRLNADEGAMKALGIATRDQSGALLNGKDLMENAMSAMMEYKEGTDRNEYALSVFGRRAIEVYDIMRVSTEGVQHQVDIYRELGVDLDGTGESSQKLEEALNDLRTIFQALEIRLGQYLMPVVTALLTWMGTDGKQFIADLADAFAELTKKAVEGIREITERLELLSHPLDHLAKWANQSFFSTGMAGDVKVTEEATTSVEKLGGAWDRLKDSVSSALDQMDHGKKLHGKKLFSTGTSEDEGGGGDAGGEQNPYLKPGGTKEFVKPGKAGKADKSQEEDIANEQKLALGKIAIEEATNSHLIAMGAESNAAFVAQARDLENQTFAVKQEALQKELGVTGQSQAAKEKILDEMQQLEQAHQGKLLQIDQDGENRRRQAAQTELQEFLKDSDEKLKVATDSLNRQFDAGKISAAARYSTEVALTNQIKGAELERLNALLATLTPGTEAYKTAYAERQKVVKTWAKDTDDATKELMAKTKEEVDNATKGFQSAFNSSFNNMLLHGKSFADGMKEMWTGLAQAVITMIEQIGEKWVAQQISDSLAGHAIQAANASAQITSEAALAGAAGFASAMASVPYPANVGVAPAVGSAASAAVLANYLPGASAAGGMLLDRDQLVFAHKGEQVLPAHLSQGIQNMIRGGGGGGGDTHLHYTANLPPQNQTLDQMLRANGRDMHAWLSREARNGSLRKSIGG